MVLCREFGKVLFEVAFSLKFSFAEEAKTHAVAESPRADADGRRQTIKAKRLGEFIEPFSTQARWSAFTGRFTKSPLVRPNEQSALPFIRGLSCNLSRVVDTNQSRYHARRVLGLYPSSVQPAGFGRRGVFTTPVAALRPRSTLKSDGLGLNFSRNAFGLPIEHGFDMNARPTSCGRDRELTKVYADVSIVGRPCQVHRVLLGPPGPERCWQTTSYGC